MGRHKKPFNQFEVDGNLVKILIPSKKFGQQVGLIDLEDLEKVRDFHWSVTSPYPGKMYLQNNRKLMHRLILDGRTIDHRNGSGLDNRKSNLRVCSQSENLHNSRYRGYTMHQGKYVSNIRVNGERIHLGRFDSAEAAQAAYRDAKFKYYPEFSGHDLL